MKAIDYKKLPRYPTQLQLWQLRKSVEADLRSLRKAREKGDPYDEQYLIGSIAATLRVLNFMGVIESAEWRKLAERVDLRRRATGIVPW